MTTVLELATVFHTRTCMLRLWAQFSSNLEMIHYMAGIVSCVIDFIDFITLVCFLFYFAPTISTTATITICTNQVLTTANSVGQQVFVVAGRGFAMQAEYVRVSYRYSAFQK